MKLGRILPFVLACATLLAGCALGGRGTNEPRTTVEVDNRGFPDMTVYIVDGGQRIRLGTATGNAKSVFTIPRYLVTTSRSLRFLADPIGSNRTAVSDEIYVRAGDTVTLMIPPS